KNLPSPPELDLSSGGEFAQKVWRLLASSEVGETFNYSEIASALDNPKASRAVGSAMANNPLPLLVPCHRVLPKSGDLGNYSALGGVETKQWLLTHESPP
ncbi:MAG: MGMT family protein, partial [Candidatus Poseidoniaceae archaeon]|nr:MGMT family protein [Candidatus Poseidoniaceae archaeon]